MIDKKLVLRVLGWVWAAFLLAWFVVPFFLKGFAAPATIPMLVGQKGLVWPLWLALGLAGVQLLWQCVSPFLEGTIPRFTRPDSFFMTALWALGSASVLFLHGSHASVFADRSAYFLNYPAWAWLSVAYALAWNGFSLIRCIGILSAKDASYKEYLDFKRASGEKTGFRGVLRQPGIQRRLTVVFTGLILLIISVMAAVLLDDFGVTILDAVAENGRGIAERSASAVKTTIADPIALSDFFSAEEAKRAEAAFPFKSLVFYRLDSKTGKASAFAATDETLIKTAWPYGDDYPAKADRVAGPDLATIDFASPVLLGGKTIGYTALSYDKEVVYAPYYRSRVKAIIVAFFFLYTSAFLTYLTGRGIVFPILFLQMGVNTLSTKLAGMIQGAEKVSPELLDYRDRVETNDEIKKLSVEIGNMATVIRGVVPYISATTLRHSDRTASTSERRDLAFLFTDIRGFTTLCEGLSPEEVVSLLNRYLDIQTAAIVENGGDVDKFVGDEIMAMFEGPDKEANACRASIAIRAAMEREREVSRQNSRAELSIGIGINSGPVVFGSVGASNRKDFTSIGDTVNLAARLEGATKVYGTKSLVSEAVYEKVSGQFVCREIDLLTVKGKTKPVRIYEVLADAGHADSEVLAMKKEFELGLAAYRSRNWAKAEKLFLDCSRRYSDEAAALFINRVHLFAANPPPADWDGVFALAVK